MTRKDHRSPQAPVSSAPHAGDARKGACSRHRRLQGHVPNDAVVLLARPAIWPNCARYPPRQTSSTNTRRWNACRVRRPGRYFFENDCYGWRRSGPVTILERPGGALAHGDRVVFGGAESAGSLGSLHRLNTARGSTVVISTAPPPRLPGQPGQRASPRPEVADLPYELFGGVAVVRSGCGHLVRVCADQVIPRTAWYPGRRRVPLHCSNG